MSLFQRDLLLRFTAYLTRRPAGECHMTWMDNPLLMATPSFKSLSQGSLVHFAAGQ